MRLSYILLADLAYKTPVGDVPLPVRKVAKVVRLVAQAEVARGEHVHLSPGKSASKLDIRCDVRVVLSDPPLQLMIPACR